MAEEKDMRAEKLKQAVELMKQGEEKGFNYVYGETYNFVYSRARLAINDEQEVQDLIQEVYVAAYRNIESLKNADSLYAWLNTITMRQGASMIRRKKKHVLLSEEKQGMFEEIPDESVELENDVVTRENAGILKELLEKLSPEQKSAIVAFYYDGLKVEQIAELTGTSTGTVKSRLHLARKHLQEYIVELEKKQGCSLRSFSAPLLLLAVKMLLEENTLSQASAQGIYNQVCSQVGVQASTLTFSSVGAGSTAMANPGGNVNAGAGWKAGLKGQMKGQGTGMNKLLSKLAGLGKVKLAAIATGAVVVIGGGAAIGVYVHNQEQAKEAQAELEKEQQEQAETEKEQEALLADLAERYEKAEELRDNLILEDAVIDILNCDFTTIKTALDEKTVDDETEEIMTTLEKNLEGYRKQNEQYLTEKEAAIMDYHTELFSQENQDAWDSLMAEYKELFEAVKYKDANAKLDEVSAGITAFLQENATEVADNEAEGNSGEESAGNSNTGSSSGNSNTGNESNGSGNNSTGSSTGNENSSSGNNSTGSNTGNENSSSGNNTGGSTGNENSSSGNNDNFSQTEEPEQTGDFANGWTYEEANILESINMAWSDFVYTDEEAQAQLAAQLPGRTCTLVHYPPEQNEESAALWRSIDRNVYCCTNRYSDDVYGSYFIYGK